MLQLTRVYGDALHRVAEAEVRLVHFYVHDRMRAAGLSGSALSSAERASAKRLVPLVEPTILYRHRRGWRDALRQDAIMHLEERVSVRGDVGIPGQMRMAVAFVDLAGFTSLADAMGDRLAADILERFSAIVRETAVQRDGQVVKQIGDAFMLVFPTARPAVDCVLEIERRTAREPRFPAIRSGIHYGEVLYREGDYIGTTVNIAARLAAEAERHQLLLTEIAHHNAGGTADCVFTPIGKRRLRGLAEELNLLSAASSSQSLPRQIDPVCGMDLGPGEEAARLTFENRERVFCSPRCLQLFVARPELYQAGA
jgi:class 3 adenylate cyclase/YHS domain-containing protein